MTSFEIKCRVLKMLWWFYLYLPNPPYSCRNRTLPTDENTLKRETTLHRVDWYERIELLHLSRDKLKMAINQRHAKSSKLDENHAQNSIAAIESCLYRRPTYPFLFSSFLTLLNFSLHFYEDNNSKRDYWRINNVKNQRPSSVFISNLMAIST